MKIAYPVILTKGKKHIIVSVPDCDIDTQGKDIVDAIEMSRDAIALWCLSEKEDGRELPKPSEISTIQFKENETITLVDVDLESYKRKHEMRTIRKNCTIPSWLNELAEKEHVNFSQILQEGLMTHLGVDAPHSAY